MRLLINILVVALLTFVAEMMLPWWGIAVVAFAVCLFFSTKGTSAFFSGFLGIFLLFFIASLIIDTQNAQLLSKKICSLFGLPQISLLLIFITALVGGLVGGFSGMTGYYFKKLFTK